jgi:hypothetical protein
MAEQQADETQKRDTQELDEFLSEIKDGVNFLKYGRLGSPHERPITLVDVTDKKRAQVCSTWVCGCGSVCRCVGGCGCGCGWVCVCVCVIFECAQQQRLSSGSKVVDRYVFTCV